MAVGLGPIWKFSDAECLQIAEPAARCLEKLPVAEIVGEYADPAALLLAVVAVVGPRLMQERNRLRTPPPAAQRTPVNEQVGLSTGGGDFEGAEPYTPENFR